MQSCSTKALNSLLEGAFIKIVEEQGSAGPDAIVLTRNVSGFEAH